MPTVALQIENLTKRYGTFTAVDHLSLDIYEGEVFGFLGPNGAGKTTSINMMCGLLKPNDGRVLFGGAPLTDPCMVGMCPQSIVLWERLTCIEQLVFMGQMYGVAGNEARQRGERLLDALELADKRHQLARTLSGGMQRRLNIAMALVHDPAIVVFDEPEAGLDPQSRVKVREYIQSLAHHKTIILTTHNMDEADRVVDRVAIIDHGKLLVLDTPERLKERAGNGDVIEIHIHGEAAGALAALRCIEPAAVYDEAARVLRVRALHAVATLPAIIEAVRGAGIEPGEIGVRRNTLEDVFIDLTGRRLRD